MPVDPLQHPDPKTRLEALAGTGHWSYEPGRGLRLSPVLGYMLDLGTTGCETHHGLREIMRILDRTGRRRLFGDLRGLLRTGARIDRALVLRAKGQPDRWFRCHAVGVDGEGPQTRLQGLVLDITTKKRIASELRHSYMIAEKAGSMAGVGSWSIDLDSKDLSWSKEVFGIYDLEPGRQPSLEEALTYYPEESRRIVESCLHMLTTDGTPMDVEVPMVTATGRAIWVRAMGDVDREVSGPTRRIYGVLQDITTQHEIARQLREREERGRLALMGSEDGVWDWWVQDERVSFSARYKEILGYAEHELEDKLEVWQANLHPDDLNNVYAHVHEALCGNVDAYRVEFRMRHKNGSWRWILARGKVVQRAADGSAIRMVGTHTDIDEQVAVREELVLAKEGAEAAAKAKASFLATMSHEIRTPLNGILGMAQILLGTEQDVASRDHTETIIQSGRALLTILNDVLDLSKVESGHLELEAEPFDLERAMENVVSLLGIEANKKGTTLQLEYAAGLPKLFLGDSVRVRQVVMNLVGNAVKFTSEGGTLLRVSPLDSDDSRLDADVASGNRSQDCLLIEIVDSGIGIDPERRTSLFEPFAQADASTTRRFGGTGLGLSICKQLVEQMGGSISAASNPLGGSIFSVALRLPALGQNTPEELLEQPPAALPAESAVRFPCEGPVLIVEDNSVNQVVARKLIERLGMTVSVVSNGSEALDAMGANWYALVLMDCQMPVMDGYEATRMQRAHERRAGLDRVPIVAMTANAMAEDRQRCLDTGMDEYISKPFVTEQLARIMARTMRAPETQGTQNAHREPGTA